MVDIPGLLVLLGITLRNQVKSVVHYPLSSPSNLDLTSSEERIVKRHGGGNRVLVGKLDIGEALGVPVELVAKDRHPVDGTATMEVLFQLLCCCSIVNISCDKTEVTTIEAGH